MAYQLTDAQIEKFKEAFFHFDLNGDGNLCIKELGNVLEYVGETLTEEQVREFVKESLGVEVDKEGNGRIEFPQFLILMGKIISNAMEEIREIFRSVDTDGNGVISGDEMEKVITDLGDVMTEEDIQQLRDVDVDGDGNINYEEFITLMISHY